MWNARLKAVCPRASASAPSVAAWLSASREVASWALALAVWIAAVTIDESRTIGGPFRADRAPGAAGDRLYLLRNVETSTVRRISTNVEAARAADAGTARSQAHPANELRQIRHRTAR